MSNPVFLHTNKQIITALTAIKIIISRSTKPPLNQSEIQKTRFLATQLIYEFLTLKPS